MKYTTLIISTAALNIFILTGCDNSSQSTSTLSTATQSTSPTSSSISSNVSSSEINAENTSTDQWVGHWKGPEGTFLEISGLHGKYQITIQNLDGPSTYPGTSKEGKIFFERNNLTETITSGDGQATGMKWLTDKTNCLVIRSGEGFCKD